MTSSGATSTACSVGSIPENIFDNIWIQPAAGDAGGALGAALVSTYLDSDCMRKIEFKDSMKGSLLGPQFSEDEITACNTKYKWNEEEKCMVVTRKFETKD